MKSLTIRLPDRLVGEIEAESQERGLSKSDVVRERLTSRRKQSASSRLGAISDLVGSVEGLPGDLSGEKKAYLIKARYGRKRSR